MAFGDRLFAIHTLEESEAFQVAQETADVNGAPVAILQRDKWLAIIEEPPDEADGDPLGHGWNTYALINPTGVTKTTAVQAQIDGLNHTIGELHETIDELKRLIVEQIEQIRALRRNGDGHVS